jgi:hypothetical protein
MHHLFSDRMSSFQNAVSVYFLIVLFNIYYDIIMCVYIYLWTI